MTGLGRFNTFHLTWPMRWRNDPILPLVAIDNVFASREFAKIVDDRRRALGLRSPADHCRHRAGRPARNVRPAGARVSVLAELAQGLAIVAHRLAGDIELGLERERRPPISASTCRCEEQQREEAMGVRKSVSMIGPALPGARFPCRDDVY